MSRLEISGLELMQLDPEDFKWCQLSNFYLTRLLRMANNLGLEGKKIKDVVGIQENFATNNRFIDFIVEDNTPKKERD